MGEVIGIFSRPKKKSDASESSLIAKGGYDSDGVFDFDAIMKANDNVSKRLRELRQKNNCSAKKDKAIYPGANR